MECARGSSGKTGEYNGVGREQKLGCVGVVVAKDLLKGWHLIPLLPFGLLELHQLHLLDLILLLHLKHIHLLLGRHLLHLLWGHRYRSEEGGGREGKVTRNVNRSVNTT